MTDLAKKSVKELLQEIEQKREKLREFRFSVAGSKLRNVREGRNLRKDIARLLTEFNERGLEQKGA